MFSKTLSLASILALTLSASAVTTTSTCYSDSGNLKSIGPSKYASTELCNKECSDRALPVAAVTGGNECWCGDETPSEDSMVNQEKCDTRCTGWPESTCGGDGFWEVLSPKIKSTGARAETFVA